MQPGADWTTPRGNEAERRERVGELLRGLRDGDAGAFEALFEVLYEELRVLAHRQRLAWKGNYTLNTTALVHEAYLKLAGQDDPDWESRAHFLAAAARAIRHILVNYARDRGRKKRGGGHPVLSLDEALIRPDEPFEMTEAHADSLLALDRALQQLERVDERQSRIVECRFFGELTIPETAVALGISTASVSRGWKYAQLWLYRELSREAAT